MRIYELLLKKRNGHELTETEIDQLITGMLSGEIPDYQIAAWLMTVYFQGMTDRETYALTQAMAASGETLDLSAIPGVKVDKHSTGGVGDKTTLVLAPLVAACGVPVAKMSGHALGHTGGTLDKLASFPGLQTALTREHFIKQVQEIGVAIAGQTGRLAPADKQLYALRDATATVDSIPLIAASVMSKKLAAGCDAMVLDVKVGKGAFMQEPDDARELARLMVSIAQQHGKQAVAVITDMSQPLGSAIGNALEVKEAIATLRDQGPADLKELCLRLGSQMLLLANRTDNVTEAEQLLNDALSSGAALYKLAQMVTRQGGAADCVYHPELLPQAPICREVLPSGTGYVQSIDTLALGLTAMDLGAGRGSKESSIDLSVGLEILVKIGDHVRQGQCVARVHANTAQQAEAAVRRAEQAFVLCETPVETRPLILDQVSSGSKA
ncbi:MAG TPA: pyrimidine-nucleoside phosphorylase [Firmicutes bacterium]|nr:pyrimidine-nucleoside phosphorylase [Bacillota bacterium]